jgi:hypothetical protein
VLKLTPTQAEAAAADGSNLLIGPAGTGKTTALLHRLLGILQAGEQAYTILVLISEPGHNRYFINALHESDLGPYNELKTVTYSALAREMITIFWPLIARAAGFESAHRPPTFLGYDLAQLMMWKTINPMMDEGMFADLRLRPQQIVSQILDTLNRAALNSLTLAEAESRQVQSWGGEPEHLRHLRDASTSARIYRQQCLDNNLLDLSLTVQVFDRHLVGHPELHRYFSERFRHLLVDNFEEQTPAGQRFVNSLLDTTETTAIVFDSGGGYKRFLGADPEGAGAIRKRCNQTFVFDHSFTATLPLIHLSNQVSNYLMRSKNFTASSSEAIKATISGRYRRDMVAAVVAYISDLMQEGRRPSEIAIITPYLDGALRFNLASMMKEAQVPYRLVRRRSSPREDPRIRSWLTWLAIAHPTWEFRPTKYDVAEALDLSISTMDPARAQIVADRLYNQKGTELRPIAELPEILKSRIGWNNLTLVEDLRLWINDQGQERNPIDEFIFRLFNELLAQPRYQPRPDLVSAAICDWLVRSASRLRDASGSLGLDTPEDTGRTFIEGIYQGLVSASPPDVSEPPDPEGVLISTMYGFLLSGQPVHTQIWLDVSANGWWDIPRQPLSNAFVLSQGRIDHQVWTAQEDFDIRNQLLSRIVQGLTRRCYRGVVLAVSDLDRRGYRQDGPLWRALQPILNKSSSRVRTI